MYKATLAIICVLFLCVGGAWAATIEVSQPTHLTANGDYDRNPSIMHDGTDYWLFYTKADEPFPAVRGIGGYDPDGDDYVVYYKTASTIAGLAGAAETKLGLSQSARPTDFDQRVVSATYFNSKVYAFVSSGQSGTNRGLHYYEYDGISWSGPTTLIADATARGGHVNVTSDASRVYIVWESSADASADCYTWDGTTLSSKIDISSDNMPKITLLMGTTLYVVSIEDGTGDIEVYSATVAASPGFSSHSTAISGAGLYDPCIFNDGTNLYVVTAPYDGGDDQQWLIQSKGTTAGVWATDKMVSFGGYGTTYWWDYWPCGYHDGTDAYVFFTTETGSPTYSDGEIACIKMDWDLGNDHYFFIQNAVDQANPSDDINVAAGTSPYTEQVYITKSLVLEGVASPSKPVISAPAAASRTTYNIPESGRTFDPIVFADGGTGVIDVTVNNFEIDGNNDGGSNTFCGILWRNTDPGTISDNDLHSLKGTGQETQGILIYGANTVVTVSGNTVIDFSRNGITANVNAQGAITGNTVTGDGSLPAGNWAQNGIQIGFGASGSITDNTVTGCSYTGPSWAASGILPYATTGTIQINGNTVTENQVNIYLADCSASLAGNTVYATATGTGQTYFYGILGDPGETKAPKPSPFGPEEQGGGSAATVTTYTVTCTDNTVESDGSSGGTGIGIYAGMYGTYDIDFTATGNTVRYWQWGFELYEYAPSNLISAEIHYNNIEGNTDYGIYNYLSKTFNAENNWYGSSSGPSHTSNTYTNPAGDPQGDAVSDNVDFVSWLDGPYPGGSSFAPVALNYVWDYASIQAAVDAASSGHTITCAAGTYNETGTFLDHAGLHFVSSKGGITLSGANAGIPGYGMRGAESIIEGPNVLHGNAIYIFDGADGVVIDGFTLEAGDDIVENRADDVVIKNNVITPVSGIPADPNAPGIFACEANDLTVAYNWVRDTGNIGMFLGLAEFSADINGLVKHNLIEDAGGAGILVNYSTGGLVIERNTIGDAGHDGIRGGPSAQGMTIEHNEIYGSARDGVRIMGNAASHHISYNSIYSSVAYGVNNLDAAKVDASCNWWGTNDPTGVAGEVSANVDYTPWLDTGTDTDPGPGFQGDLSVLNVDDDSPQTGASGRIQEGIDEVTGGIVNVMAGTYREYLIITKDNLTVQGAGIDQSIIDLDGLTPYWHYGMLSGSFSMRGGVSIVGYQNTGGSANLIENVTFKGFTVKNAGVNPPIMTGTHTGPENASNLTDNTASWDDNELVGQWITNASDYLDTSGGRQFFRAKITGNTKTTVTATYISGGNEKDWDIGDTYVISPYREWYDGALDGRDDVRGIRITSGKNIKIEDCKIQYSGDRGISTGRSRFTPRLPSEDITIKNCDISDNHDAGIGVGDTKGTITITGNTVSNNNNPTTEGCTYSGSVGPPDCHVTGMHIGGRSTSMMLSGTISGNTVSGNAYHGITVYKYTDGITVENNTVTGHNLNSEGAGIFVSTGWGWKKTCKNHAIRDNIVTDNIRGIVVYWAFGDNPGDLSIEGNTITTDAGTFAAGQAAIKIDRGYNLEVKDNTISCDGTGITVVNSGTCDNDFTGNTIENAKFAGVFIYRDAHDNTFTNNIITGTSALTRWAGQPYEETQGDGVFLWGYPGKEAGTGNVFHFNDIYKNDDDGMENQTATTVDAEFNWWGDKKGPSGEGPGKKGDSVSTNVEYSPWLAKKAGSSPMTWGTDDSIQEAIDAAAAGDKIEVYPGQYYGAIVDRAVEIKAKKGVVINDGPFLGSWPLRIGFYFPGGGNGSGAKISKFTFRGDGTTNGLAFPIFSRGANNVTVEGNTLINCLQGITNWHGSMWKIKKNTIDGLWVSGGGGIGIFLGSNDGTATNRNLVEKNKIEAYIQNPPTAFSTPGIALMSDARYGRIGGPIKGNKVKGNSVAVQSTQFAVGCELTDQSAGTNDVTNNWFEKNTLVESTIPWAFNPKALIAKNFFKKNKPQPGGPLCGLPTTLSPRPFGPEEVVPSALDHSGTQLVGIADARLIFNLSQNNPNPFAGETSISYVLPASGHATLKIFDVSGRVVETLVDTELSPGIYSVNWDRKDTASGTYFYRLSSNGKTLTRKMTVVR